LIVLKIDLSVLASERSYRIILLGNLSLPDGFTSSAAIRVYFCDPKSPWQRATSENTNMRIEKWPPGIANYGQLAEAKHSWQS
jgi:hypothetical protein